MVIHLHPLLTARLHQLDSLLQFSLKALDPACEMVAFCYLGGTLRMSFVNFQSLLHIPMETVVQRKIAKCGCSSQINVCNLNTLFTVEFESYIESMLVEGDHLL